ncbi:MAG TPA: hypothetical protein VHM70_14730 [Polyangiaceae bacterium]|jgi:hypothetical protein|nr:hypothetical protein [Polyangiaceae bacterium]
MASSTIGSLAGGSVFALLVCACANPEALQANQVAAERLHCDPETMAAGVERETAQVREWIVGCNFTYTRVHCRGHSCYQAPPKPPCIGNLPCFVEDPVTLEWVLQDAPKPR